MHPPANRYWAPWINYSLLVLATGAYLAINYFAPAASNNTALGLSQAQIALLQLTIYVPYIIAWSLAVYGLTVLGSYIKTLGPGENEFTTMLKSLHKGLWWIIIGVFLAALIGGLRRFMPENIGAITIITNYLNVFPLLIGFWVIYKGLRGIMDVYHTKTALWRGDSLIKTIIVILLFGFYVFLVFTNPTRQAGIDAMTPATYFLPDWLIITTITIPVFIVWWLGFSVAFRLSDLIPHFMRAFNFIAMNKILYGIWAIVFTSILVQALLSLGATRLRELGIGIILVIIYIFLLVNGIGYLLIALGVRKLKKAATNGP